MKWQGSGDVSRLWRLLVVFLVFAAVASPGLAQTNAAEKRFETSVLPFFSSTLTFTPR